MNVSLAKQSSSSIKDFMERHGIGRNCVYEEITSGRLKTIKVGRRRLIPQSCEAEWLNDKLIKQ